VLTPRIVGKRVGLGETGALFAVLAGGKLLGFTGVLLAVPIAASVAVLIRRLAHYYERSEFFGAGDPDSSAPEPPVPLSPVAAVVSISADDPPSEA
jgi:predicted PurR-regulated permease PerM